MRLPCAIAILAALVLAGCEPSAGDRFRGRWRSDRGTDEITIGERGLGSGRVLFIRTARPFTWRAFDAERIAIEFGETTATRTALEGQLRDDGTLVVRHLKSSTILRRVAADDGKDRP